MLWPLTTAVNDDGHLTLAGVDLVALAREYGTPLYLYDEATIRDRCRRYQEAFVEHYPRSAIVYAAKAYLSPALLAILREEGCWLDVVSAGELGMALRAGFPVDRIVFHGNNKSPAELREAIVAGVARIVVDNLLELERIIALGAEYGGPVPILLRLNPGVEAHTHELIQTGVVDSKFGLPMVDEQAEQAVARALHSSAVQLLGYHAHIGSQIFGIDAYRETISIFFRFAARMRARYGFTPAELSPGGGLGIAYTSEDESQEVSHTALARIIGETIHDCAARYQLPEPSISIEPGRSIIGSAGITLYTVGAIKEIPGVRRYVAVDGGMADNIRPALYDALYTVAVANRPGPDFPRPAPDAIPNTRIVGKYCESGDFLVRDLALPPVEPGDLLAFAATGAYCLAMSSNYNLAMRPAVVFVADGAARLVRRRETLDDLLRTEVLPG